MLAKREQWLPRLYLRGVLDIDILEKAAQQIINEHLQSLNKTATNYFDQNFFNLISKNTRHDVKQIKKLPSPEISDLENWKILSDLCLTKSGQWRKKIDKNLGFPAELKEQKKELLMILTELRKDDCLKNQLMELIYCLMYTLKKPQTKSSKISARFLNYLWRN